MMEAVRPESPARNTPSGGVAIVARVLFALTLLLSATACVAAGFQPLNGVGPDDWVVYSPDRRQVALVRARSVETGAPRVGRAIEVRQAGEDLQPGALAASIDATPARVLDVRWDGGALAYLTWTPGAPGAFKVERWRGTRSPGGEPLARVPPFVADPLLDEWLAGDVSWSELVRDRPPAERRLLLLDARSGGARSVSVCRVPPLVRAGAGGHGAMALVGWSADGGRIVGVIPTSGWLRGAQLFAPVVVSLDAATGEVRQVTRDDPANAICVPGGDPAASGPGSPTLLADGGRFVALLPPTGAARPAPRYAVFTVTGAEIERTELDRAVLAAAGVTARDIVAWSPTPGALVLGGAGVWYYRADARVGYRLSQDLVVDGVGGWVDEKRLLVHGSWPGAFTADMARRNVSGWGLLTVR